MCTVSVSASELFKGPHPDSNLFVALYDYDARTNEELSFKKGEHLEVINVCNDTDWLFAKSKATNREGYVPSNYVAKLKPIPHDDNEDWSWIIGKKEALKEKELGNQAYRKKNFLIAISHYDKAIQLDSTELTFHNNKAAVYFEMKDFSKCVKCCEKAVEVGKENSADLKLVAKAMSRMGSAYRKLGKLPEAKDILKKAFKEHRTPKAKKELCEVEKELKLEEEKAYQDPSIAEIEKKKGNEKFKTGDFAGAVLHYTEAIKRNPTDHKIMYNRATCFTKLMCFDLALTDCDNCIQVDASFVKAYLSKGKVLKAMGLHRKAADVYQEALKFEPNNIEALDGCRVCFQHLYSEDVQRRAMANPEVQQILGDPAMQGVLKQIQMNPSSLREHIQNRDIKHKIIKLKEVGIISVIYGLTKPHQDLS